MPKIQCCGIQSPINTAYELLWKGLKEIASNSGITIQIIMRRTIEKFTDDKIRRNINEL